MMDPYKVLGVSSDATDDEIKKAYRTLAKKYHPDLHVGKPDAAEAEKKFLEVQQAYDTVMKMRQGGGTGAQGGYGNYGSYGGYGTQGGGYSDPFEEFFRSFGGYQRQTQSPPYGQSETQSRYQAAANYINMGRYQEALNTLAQINERGAQWYYLSAYAHAQTGQRMTAIEHAQKACQMEPGNYQYRQLLSELERSGQSYRQTGQGYGRTVMGGGNMCMQLCVAQTLCALCTGRPGWLLCC